MICLINYGDLNWPSCFFDEKYIFRHEKYIFRHILVSHFGHLASLVWAKLILGRFRDAVLPDFSRFPIGSGDYLNAFFTDPRHGHGHGRYYGRYVPGA